MADKKVNNLQPGKQSSKNRTVLGMGYFYKPLTGESLDPETGKGSVWPANMSNKGNGFFNGPNNAGKKSVTMQRPDGSVRQIKRAKKTK